MERNRLKLPLSAKLVLITSLLFFGVFSGSVIYNYQTVKSQLVSDLISNRLPENADRISKIINARLAREIQFASTVCQSTFLINWLQTDQGDVSELIDYLKRLQKSKNIRYIGVASKKSENMYNISGQFSTIYEVPGWFDETANTSGDIRIEINNNVGGKYYLWFDHKIKDYSGDFIGIFWAGLAVNDLVGLIADIKVGVDGDVFMVNSDGDIKTHRNQDLVTLEFESDSLKNFKNVAGISEVADQLLTSDEVVHYDTEKGRTYALARSIPDLDWRVVVEAYEEDLIGPLKTRLWQGVMLGFGVLVLTALISIWIVNGIVLTPLREFQSGLFQFFEFLERKTPRFQLFENSRNDEIGLMIDKVNEYVRRLESGIMQDHTLIKEVQMSLESMSGGQIVNHIKVKPHNPELIRLKDSFIQVIDILRKKVGSDINDINSVLDDYGKMKFDRKLESQEGEIERKVNEIGRELEEKNAQLVEKQELERANKELSQFAQVTSHDLKSPLRGIGNLAGIVIADNQQNLDKKSIEDLQLLIDRVKWMEDLINNILEYSNAGNPDQQEECNLQEVVHTYIESNNYNTSVEIQIDNKLPVVKGNKMDWERIFQNLIENAIKHNDKEQTIINIGYEQNTSSHIFFVSDNGPGISLRHHERVFQMFQTLDNRHKTGNSGIGLSIVKKIIELRKGKIWIDKENKVGTKICFTYPLSGSN